MPRSASQATERARRAQRRNVARGESETEINPGFNAVENQNKAASSATRRTTRSEARKATVQSNSIAVVPDSAATRQKKRTPTSHDAPTISKKSRSSAPRRRSGPNKATTVTPGTPVRQLRFEETSETSSMTTVEQNVPAGVVDIFSCNVCTCRCPSTVSLEKSTALATAYMAKYGLENEQEFKRQEREEFLRGFIPGSLFVPDSDFESSDEERSDAESSSDTKQTPRPGSVVRYNPNALKEKQKTLETNDNLPRQPFLSARMRAVLVNWLVEIGQEYGISESAFHLSVTLLDSVLSKGPGPDAMKYLSMEEIERKFVLVHKDSFQALGCACTWIAAKMEDKSSPSADDFVYISDHSFTDNALRELERSVCAELDFRLHRVTPYHYVNLYLLASHACPNPLCNYDHTILRELVLYFLELSRLPVELLTRLPSLLTASALYLARATLGIRELNPDHAVGEKGYWTKTLEHYTSYSLRHLKKTVLAILRYHQSADSLTTKASFDKYSRRNRYAVSFKTALREEELGFPASFGDDDDDIDEE